MESIDRRLIREWGASLVAGVAAGAVTLGLLGRVVMRIVALLASLPVGGSIGGTLEVVATGALIGGVAGPLYLLARPHLPGPRTFRGVEFGLGVFFVLLLMPPGAALSAASSTRHVQLYVVASFAALFALFGAALEAAIRRLVLLSRTE